MVWIIICRKIKKRGVLHTFIAVLRKIQVMDQKTEAQIVARVMKGDRQAYALLVEEYKTPVYNLAYRMTGSPSDAEDLAQEAFLTSYRQISRFDITRSFFTWLYTISLNIIRNHLKKAGRGFSDMETPVAAGDPDPDASGREPSELEEQLELGLQKLPPELRELIVLRFYQGLSFEAVADIAGLTEGAVKMRIYRGLEKLKEILRESVTFD